MIDYSDGTVFNTEAQTLVNTVNCAGAMGAGIALEFRLRFPAMFTDYAARCRRKEVRAGHPYIYKGDCEPWVLNFPTKDHWRTPSRIKWVEAGLIRFAESYREWGIKSAAFPPLGCAHGRLEWGEVQPLMERYLGPLDLKVTVCLDREPDAHGVEARMVGIVNDTARDSLWNRLNLTEETMEAVRAALPLRRFRELMPLLDKKTYAGLFRHLYAAAASAPETKASVVEKPDSLGEAIQLTFSF